MARNTLLGNSGKLIFFLFFIYAGVLRIYFIDVGQGDAALIETPNYKHYLIDTGGIPHFLGEDTVCDNILIPFLESVGVHKLSGVFISHPHGDHIAALPGLLKKFNVLKVYDPAKGRPDPEYDEALEVIDEKNIEYEIIKEGDVIELDKDVNVEVLAPPRKFEFEGTNDNSSVLKITYSSISVLFTGDVEEEAETWLAGRWGRKLSSTVLKAPHHGSRTSSIPLFLQYVKPKYTIISAGRYNLFGHPNPEVYSRLKKISRVYLTAIHGTILLETDGREVKISYGDKIYGR